MFSTHQPVFFHRLLAFFIVVCGISACQIGEEESGARVTIYNAFTGEPVKGVDVLLYQAKGATPEKPNPDKKSLFLGQGVTDEQGQYDFGVFSMKKSRAWKCVMSFSSQPDNYRLYFGLTDTILQKGVQNDVIMYTYPLAAGVRLNFSPGPPYAPGDSIKVTFMHSSGDHFTISDQDYLDGIIGYSDIYMGNYSVTIRKKKAGVLTIDHDSFFIKVNEELQYNVPF